MKTLLSKRFQAYYVSNRISLNVAAAAFVIVLVLGSIFLSRLFAAGFFAAIEPENSTLATNASVINDASASNGKAIQFNAPVTTPPPPTGPCTLKPGSANVGSSGTLASRPVGDVTLSSGQTLENAKVTGKITVRGTNVTVRNVFATGGLWVQNSNTVMIDRVTLTEGMAISSSQNVTMQYSNIGPTTEDATHVTSDSGSMNQNITFTHNYIHSPNAPPGAHYDGTQIRGVQTMNINCSTYDLGTYQDTYNAAIYSEHPANGGNFDVTVANNWLYGGAFIFMGSGPNIKLLNNRIGGDIHWGPCYPGDLSTMTSTGNVWDATNEPVTLCK